MKIKFINAHEEKITKGKNTYQKLTVTFVNLGNGKVEVKNMMDFATDKEVYERLTGAKADDVFEVESKKNDAGFWQWTGIAKGVDSGEAPVEVAAPKFDKPAAKSSNTYEENNKLQRERFEFDKLKQPLIIRQSCLGYAVDYTKDAGMAVDEVLSVAEQFVTWVQQSGVQHLTDDIPE